MNKEQKKHQYLKFLEKDRYLDIVNYESLVCDDGHGVVCMVCYWQDNKHAEYDHDKFDNCMSHIQQKHTVKEIMEYEEHD